MRLSYSINQIFTGTLLVALLSFGAALGQGSVTLKGLVTDKSTGEPLPGANLVVKGSSLGGAADIDGVYFIFNVPAGKRTVEVSYLGYQTLTVELDLSGSGSVQQNFALDASVVEGEVVVVTAQAQGQLAAINQQLASDKIANIVSEQRIQELPDFNAAAALSRLPGVSTVESSGEANKVVIRGLAPQFNAVAVEGVKLASTGSTQIGVTSQGGTSGSISNDRSVDLSMVTPYMIKTIQVYKSLTPDMDANAVGGSVNMELREAPSGWSTDLLFQSGYTDKSKNYGNFRTVISGSNRFYDDKLGAYVLFNAESYDRDADNMQANYGISQHQVGDNGFEPVRVRDVQLNRHLETRKRFGGNLILDYKLPNGSLKAINMFTRLNSDFDDYRSILNYTNKNLDFRYRGGENTIDLAVNSLNLDYDFNFMQMDMKFASTRSKNSLPEAPDIVFWQTGAIIGAIPENTIPDSLVQQIEYRGAEDTYSRSLSLFSTLYKETNNSFKSNFKFPISLGSQISGYLKVGGEYRHENHTNDQNTPYVDLGSSGTGFQRDMMDSLVARFGIPYDPISGRFVATDFTNGNPDLTDPFLKDRFGAFYWAVDPDLLTEMVSYLRGNPMWSGRATGTETGGWFEGPYQTEPNDYTYKEDYSAGYLMGDFSFLNFNMVGGVRYEKVKMNYSAVNMVDARNPDNQPIFPITVTPENDFLLPMFQVRFKPFEWGDVRYAFTKTLARPDYHQLSPKHSIDFSGQNIWAGNPDLVPAESKNHDLIFSFHANKLGLFSVGAFHKTIKNFTFYTQYKLHQSAPAGLDSVGSFTPAPNDGATLYTYMNSPYESTVKGIELDFQSSLWYMPFPLNGVVFGVNYTRIESEATYPWRDDFTAVNPSPPPRFIVFTKDSTRTGRLINQPNDIFNAYLGYDFKRFSARMSFYFQGNSVRSIGAFQEQDSFTRDFFRMDASAKFLLPWKGSEIFLDLNNLNSETNRAAQRSIGGFANQQNYGLTGNLGLRYRW